MKKQKQMLFYSSTTSLFTSLFISVLFICLSTNTLWSQPSGRTLYFPGTGYIDCGPATPYFNDELTIEAWIKPSSSDIGGSSIIGAEGIDGANVFGLFIRLNDLDKTALDFTIANNAWTNVTTPSGLIIPDQWTHIAVTFNSEDAFVYVNGTEVADLSLAAPYALSSQTNVNWLIGDLSLFGGRSFTGEMGDVRVWNTIRTPSEISNNMNSYFSPIPNGMVANWQMDQLWIDNVLTDQTGNHDGEINWLPSVKFSNPNPLMFPGNGYVDCGSVLNYYNDELTIEAWINPSAADIGGSTIIGAEETDPVAKHGFYIALNELDKSIVEVKFYDNNETITSTPSGAIKQDTWSHIAVTYNSEELKIYINGIELVSQTLPATYYLPSSSDLNFYLGDKSTDKGDFFTGGMSDVRIWNKVRSQNEIEDNFRLNFGSPKYLDSLGGYYFQWAQETMNQIENDFRIPGTDSYYDDELQNIPSYFWGNIFLFYALTEGIYYDSIKYTQELKTCFNNCEKHWHPDYNSIGGYSTQQIHLYAGGIPNRFNDENGWMSIGLCEAFNATKDSTYLKKAKAACDFAFSNEDTVLGGGLYFKEYFSYYPEQKNTVTNAVGALSSIMIYEITNESHYLNNALRIEHWLASNLMDSTDFLFYDAQLTGDRSINAGKWTCNAGFMIRLWIKLYQATGDITFLNKAKTGLASTENTWHNPSNGSFRDAVILAFTIVDSWFDLYELENDDLYLEKAFKSVDYLYKKLKDANGRYPLNWHSPSPNPLNEYDFFHQTVAAYVYFKTGKYFNTKAEVQEIIDNNIGKDPNLPDGLVTNYKMDSPQTNEILVDNVGGNNGIISWLEVLGTDNNIKPLNFSIYPTFVSDGVFYTANKSNKPIQIRISDLNGQRVFNVIAHHNKITKHSIPPNINPGMYFASCIIDNRKVTHKIIIR